MVKYILTEKSISERTCFGIAAVLDGGKVDVIEDVAPTFEEVARLAGFLQEHAVPAEHFRDVVEDCLSR